MRGIFSWHTLDCLIPTKHRLSTRAWLSVVADDIHPLWPQSSLDGCFLQYRVSLNSNNLKLFVFNMTMSENINNAVNCQFLKIQYVKFSLTYCYINLNTVHYEDKMHTYFFHCCSFAFFHNSFMIIIWQSNLKWTTTEVSCSWFLWACKLLSCQHSLVVIFRILKNIICAPVSSERFSLLLRFMSVVFSFITW